MWLDDFSAHDTFPPHSDPNLIPPVAVTCLKIKGCEVNCGDVNYPVDPMNEA